jgi:hypothetical protein
MPSPQVPGARVAALVRPFDGWPQMGSPPSGRMKRTKMRMRPTVMTRMKRTMMSLPDECDARAVPTETNEVAVLDRRGNRGKRP